MAAMSKAYSDVSTPSSPKRSTELAADDEQARAEDVAREDGPEKLRSAIQPRRRMPPMSSTRPTRMASVAASAAYSSLPSAASGARMVATMMATVDSGPTFSSRLLPHSQ